MKLTKNQLRHLIDSEQKTINEERITEIKQVDEGIRDWAEKAGGAARDITSFAAGIRKFLQSNKDWIEPVYNMISNMRQPDMESGRSSQGVDDSDPDYDLGVRKSISPGSDNLGPADAVAGTDLDQDGFEDVLTSRFPVAADIDNDEFALDEALKLAHKLESALKKDTFYAALRRQSNKS